MQRSPWTGLTASEALELSDHLTRPENTAREPAEALWDAHVTYARRAVAALVGNDLRGALRAADLSSAALVLRDRYDAADVQHQAHAIVDEHPAAAHGTEAAAPAWPTHLGQPTQHPERVAIVRSS